MTFLQTIDEHILDDADLAGPIVYCFLLGGFLLLAGKVHLFLSVSLTQSLSLCSSVFCRFISDIFMASLFLAVSLSILLSIFLIQMD